VLGWNLGPNFR